MENMGLLIRQKRKEKGFTQKDLAALLNVSDKTVSKWERNESYPEITLLTAIAQTLEISVQHLLTGEEKIIEKPQEVQKATQRYLQRRWALKIQIACFIAFLFPFLHFFTASFLFENMAATQRGVMVMILALIIGGIFMAYLQQEMGEKQDISLPLQQLLRYLYLLGCSFCILIGTDVVKEVLQYKAFPVEANKQGNSVYISFGVYPYIFVLAFILVLLLTCFYLRNLQNPADIFKNLTWVFLGGIFTQSAFFATTIIKGRYIYNQNINLSNGIKRLKEEAWQKIAWFSKMDGAVVAVILVIGFLLFIFIKNKTQATSLFVVFVGYGLSVWHCTKNLIVPINASTYATSWRDTLVILDFSRTLYIASAVFVAPFVYLGLQMVFAKIQQVLQSKLKSHKEKAPF